MHIKSFPIYDFATVSQQKTAALYVPYIMEKLRVDQGVQFKH